MGNWNRRYRPRTKYRNYEYEDPPLSFPNTYNNYSGGENTRVPSWEIDYCNSSKVPWNKVLASKKYIYCYPSVLNWDASAGKQALQDAKQRYWAMINGFPCDNPLPNPDMYIDEIDWNPFMDPELMEDLDLQVIDPDDAHMVDKLETINEEVECVQAQCNKNQSNNDNPWESNNVQGTLSSKDAVQGWGMWDETINLKNDNPWEQSCNKPSDFLQDNAWKTGNASGNWNKWIDNRKTVDVREVWGNRENNTWRNENESRGWNKGINNRQTMPVRQEGWGNRESNTWRSGNESWCKRESEYWDSRRSRQSGRSFRGGCRKRESSLQHTTRYKSSRYQSNAYGDNSQF